MSEWIPIKTRLQTDEEKEAYNSDGELIIVSELPEDGQEVLVSYNGYVCFDTFYRDSEYGCYFEDADIENVDAWMPLPKPYKEVTTDADSD